MHDASGSASSAAELKRHAAFEKWLRLRPAAIPPHAVESLKPEGRHSAVFRLCGVDPAGRNVIAKRAGMNNISVERAVYEQILARIPVCTPELYGFVEDETAGYGWLFFEDVGDEPYSAQLSEHRSLAGEWLGILHTAAATIPNASHLPDRDATYYFDRVQAAHETLVRCLPNPALQGDYAAIVTTMICQCELVLAHRAEIAAICARIPKTVVHGDFSFKNVRVRSSRMGPVLAVFDWESAGWAVPAADLPWIDAERYCSAVCGQWPHLNLDDIESLASVGKLFRCMAATPGEGASLASEWVDRSMRKIVFYRDEVAQALHGLGWAN